MSYGQELSLRLGEISLKTVAKVRQQKSYLQLDCAKCLQRRIKKEGSRFRVESVLTRKEVQWKCLFFNPEVSSNFWVLSLVSRVIVNFTSWFPGLRSRQTFSVEGKLSWAGKVTR